MLPPEVVQNLRKFVLSVSPRSYCSRRSRFRILNQSDHCISNREMRENRDTICGLFFLVRTVRVICGSWNSKGVSAINLTAKHAKTANKEWSVPRKAETFQEALPRPSKGRRSPKVSTEVECTPLRRKRGLDATRATIFWEVSFRTKSTISTKIFFTSVVTAKLKRIAWTIGTTKSRGRNSLWRNISASRLRSEGTSPKSHRSTQQNHSLICQWP